MVLPHHHALISRLCALSSAVPSTTGAMGLARSRRPMVCILLD